MDMITTLFNNNIGDPLVTILKSLEFIGTSTHVFKLPFLDTLIDENICELLKLELPIIKYTVSLFLVYPFALLLKFIPIKYDNIRHLYCCIIGILLMQWVYSEDWIHSFISSIVTYIICKHCPPKYVGKLVFLWAMGYMTMSHWYRMYTSYMSYIFDFTGTQMVITMKLSSFAYNYYDGIYDYENVLKSNDDRKKYAITKLPSLIQFLGYMYCFTCIMAGPAYEYNDYVQVIDGSIYNYPKNNKKNDSENKIKTPPSSILPGLRKLFVGIVFLVIHIVFSGFYPLIKRDVLADNTIKMVPTFAHPEFLAIPNPIIRMYTLILTLLAERYKYYFAWKVAEGSCILAGFGFEGYDDNGKVIGWKGVENVDIFSFDTSWNIANMSKAWNKRTQKWLERYTYARTGKSHFWTYFVSAFWHGLYPGFYFFFLVIPIVVQVEKLVRDKINPIMIPAFNHKDPNSYPYDAKGIFYCIFGFICYITIMKYFAQTFALGSYENCLIALSSFSYFGHVALGLTYILLLLIPSSKKSVDKLKSSKKEQ